MIMKPDQIIEWARETSISYKIPSREEKENTPIMVRDQCHVSAVSEIVEGTGCCMIYCQIGISSEFLNIHLPDPFISDTTQLPVITGITPT